MRISCCVAISRSLFLKRVEGKCNIGSWKKVLFLFNRVMNQPRQTCALAHTIIHTYNIAKSQFFWQESFKDGRQSARIHYGLIFGTKMRAHSHRFQLISTNTVFSCTFPGNNSICFINPLFCLLTHRSDTVPAGTN